MRWAQWVVWVVATGGCATYRDDLDRAAGHYLGNRYDDAIAMLEVLERDIDSLSAAERARYAYFRGMSHFRVEQKHDARFWLGVAVAREKADAGSLSAEEKKRVEDTLSELNKARYGAGAQADVVCGVDGDCPPGHFCDAGRCKSPDADQEDAAAADEKRDDAAKKK